MLRYLLLIILFLCSCGNDEPDIIVVQPRLPKIDCREHLRQVGAGFAQRGIHESSAAKRAGEREKKWCEEENERRGY